MADVTFDQLTKALNNLTTSRGLDPILQSSALQIAHETVSLMSRYPGESHSPVKWKSKKQRAWYFAMRRAAGLSPQYTRISDPMSQKLRQSWGVKKIGSTGAIAGNRATYGPKVQSDEFQTAQHEATGWITDKKAVDSMFERNRIPKIVMGNLKKGINRAFTQAGGM